MLLPIDAQRVLRLLETVIVLLLMPVLTYAAERRGGIEIGSKGVKATVVEIGDGPVPRSRPS